MLSEVTPVTVSYTHLDVYKRQVVNSEYIDKHSPVGRVSALVVPDNCDNNVTHLGLTMNTNGDWIKNNNVDLVYDKIEMGDDPKNYYYGIKEMCIRDSLHTVIHIQRLLLARYCVTRLSLSLIHI